jgi:hypothetical protein
VFVAVVLAERVVVVVAEVFVGVDSVLDDVVCGRVDHCLVGLATARIRALAAIRGNYLEMENNCWFYNCVNSYYHLLFNFGVQYVLYKKVQHMQYENKKKYYKSV